MQKLIIVGTGTYAEVAHFYLNKSYEIIGFSEEEAFKKSNTFLNLPNYTFEFLDDLQDFANINFLVAIGPNKVNSIRERLYTELKIKGAKFIKFIHPKAEVWSEDAIGENTFIFPNCNVEPFAKVGNNCVLWSGASVAHHTIVHNNVFMAPGSMVSGNSEIKNNCFVGINSTIRDNVIIAENCIIGAGAVIKKNTVANGVYSTPNTTLYNTNSNNTKV